MRRLSFAMESASPAWAQVYPMQDSAGKPNVELGEKGRKIVPKGDFTAGIRLLWIATLAVGIGVLCTFVSIVLLWLIAFFTNVFFFQEVSLQFRPPAGSHVGWTGILIPVIGGLIIGLMARFGSDRIRGHGIPEAIEAILTGRSRMQLKVAVLKPLSSAISIGAGGPFGAEGPIIMTGGAVGSIIAQVFRLTAAERKTLLVAGAAGGMAAIFATPFAAVLLAVELLLFEWKPRSLIPVALASAVAALVRSYLSGPGPLFPMAAHPPLEAAAWFSSALLGLMAGVLALFLTFAVYATEDAFHRIPLHWMWWPALGGLVVGIGGYFQPRALGVGYDLIEDLLQGRSVLALLLPLLAVKCCIWSAALGSGTSGGVLAPLLIMGGGLGAFASTFLPGGDPGLWALVAMAAILGGTMRSPLTGAIFTLELTQDINALPALLVASIIAHAFTVLVMKRSILTEKVARRGCHVSREYSVDPLERLSVGEVMSLPVTVIPAGLSVRQVLQQFFQGQSRTHRRGYPVVDGNGHILGMITRSDLLESWVVPSLSERSGAEMPGTDAIIAYDLVDREPITVFPWESCRTAAERMAESGVGRLGVISPEHDQRIVGIITRSDLLKPLARHFEEEIRRERFLELRRKSGLVA
jgi:H+/Cl- antiporter ClcA